ncbi:MAG: hypothetical protein Ta2A_18640 [Treponemataceae bacterium]|nr:MAG: hypothetical protein Ta2A_18640 [Treponemataceae bacterium]
MVDQAVKIKIIRLFDLGLNSQNEFEAKSAKDEAENLMKQYGLTFPELFVQKQTGENTYYDYTSANQTSNNNTYSNYTSARQTSSKNTYSNYTSANQKSSNNGIIWLLIFIAAAIIVYKSYEKDFDFHPKKEATVSKSDFYEGQKIDTNNNGVADFIVKNGHFIGSVSGKDFGLATKENLKKQMSSTTPVKPATVPPAKYDRLHPKTRADFRNYTWYDIDEYLSVNGLTITSNRSHELPENIKNKVRDIGDYLHNHYTYGTYKSYNGIGEDSDTVFDCDDFAGLMYRMGRQAGLDIYIIDLPGHWANAIKYGNTLYTIEPQGVYVRYRDTSRFGNLTVKEYAKYATSIVVEK